MSWIPEQQAARGPARCQQKLGKAKHSHPIHAVGRLWSLALQLERAWGLFQDHVNGSSHHGGTYLLQGSAIFSALRLSIARGRGPVTVADAGLSQNSLPADLLPIMRKPAMQLDGDGNEDER